MFVPERYNQYKCASLNCFYSSAEVDNIIDHIKIIHTIDPVFNFECVNRLPIRCRRKFLTFFGLEKHLTKGAVVAQWLWSWFNLKTLCAKGRRFKSPPGHLIQRKFSMKRKNSMIYGPTTTVLHSQPSDTYWARLGKKTDHPKKPNYCPIKCLLIIANK